MLLIQPQSLATTIVLLLCSTSSFCLPLPTFDSVNRSSNISITISSFNNLLGINNERERKKKRSVFVVMNTFALYFRPFSLFLSLYFGSIKASSLYFFMNAKQHLKRFLSGSASIVSLRERRRHVARLNETLYPYLKSTLNNAT